MFKTRFDRSRWEVHSEECYEVPRLVTLDYLENRFVELAAKGKTLCLIDSRDGHEISQDELLARAKSLAAFFQRSGLRQGDLVCLRGTNCVETALAFLALLFMQCTVLSVKPVQTLQEIRSLLQGRPVRAAVSLGAYVADLELLKASIPSLDFVFNLNESKVWSLSESDFTRPPQADSTQVIALMVGTSGSTGPPKLIQHSHYSFLATLWDIRESHPVALGRGLSTSPLSHMSGLMMMMCYLRSGNPYVLVEESIIRDSMSALFDYIGKYRVEHCLLMPVMFKAVADSDVQQRHQLESLKYINTGGSLLDETAVPKMFQNIPNIKYVFIWYGMSEVAILGGARIDVNIPQENFKWSEVGPNTSLRIEDPDTRKVLPPGEVGELVAKSPAVALAYFNNPKATAETFISVDSGALSERWLRTGDLAVMDAHGRISIVDRLKQMIKCLDCQVVPSDLEKLLRESLPPSIEVSQLIVAGIPHERYIEAPTAFIVPQNLEPNVDQLRCLARQMMKNIDDNCAYYKRMYGGIAFIRSVPKTESGKFSKPDLRDQHLQRTLDYIAYVEYEAS